ncbi:ferredoxin reductase family protein [Schumannella soli]|uniref:Oxidoreductase n=1 Tax=Schumannella soli TaxID=2590779 RepID=A0A506XVJ9_9MICO|nr:ferredoxin reductase family protein [Schumannella soli]TPW74196.1 oxidoreductase [Schumannella soli]
MTGLLTAPTATASAAPAVSSRLRRHRRRHARADLLTIVAWASTALAVSLFLADGVTITGLGDALTAGGIIAGLVGSNLVLIMLVLAARIPLIDRTIGHDRAIAGHRRLGKPAFYLLLGHGALLTAGYAYNDRVNVAAETASLFSSPDMPLAYLSIALFVAVIVTSLIAVRRRLRYEVWHLIHLLSYGAVIAALPHQFSQGQVFAEGTAQRVYWIALYVVALGSIVTFRFVEPLVQSLRHRVVVDRVERIGADAVSIHLRGRGLSRLKAEGGQFFQWRFWSRRTWWHAHPISLSSAPTDHSARITIRELGDGTRRLAQLVPGTPVSFEGPYGVFTDSARGRDEIVVVTAGIGMTPARALLERLEAAPGAVTVLVRASDATSTYLWQEIHEICRQRGWRSYLSIGRRADGAAGWLSQEDRDRGVTFDSVFPRAAAAETYICGSDAWADLVEAELEQRSADPRHIHRERFDW